MLSPSQQAFADKLDAKARLEKGLEQKYKPQLGVTGANSLPASLPNTSLPVGETKEWSDAHIPSAESELPSQPAELAVAKSSGEGGSYVLISDHADEIMARQARHEEDLRAIDETHRTEVTSLHAQIEQLQNVLSLLKLSPPSNKGRRPILSPPPAAATHSHLRHPRREPCQRGYLRTR